MRTSVSTIGAARSCSGCWRRASREARCVWRRTPEVVRQIYDIDDPDLAVEFVERLGVGFQNDSCLPELNQLGRTIVRWSAHIAAWHPAHVSNGPTEAINNLVKRVRRVAFGFPGFTSYRLERCSTPASPTGTYSRRSHAAEREVALYGVRKLQ